MPISKLDQIYRSILLSKYFIKGWGSSKNLKRLLQFRKVFSSRESCINLVGEEYPLEFSKDEIQGDFRIIEGCFSSPFDLYLPTLLPTESKTAYFQMIFPKKWKDDNYKPVCIHFAGTGDHSCKYRSGMTCLLIQEKFSFNVKTHDKCFSYKYGVRFSKCNILATKQVLEALLSTSYTK